MDKKCKLCRLQIDNCMCRPYYASRRKSITPRSDIDGDSVELVESEEVAGPSSAPDRVYAIPDSILCGLAAINKNETSIPITPPTIDSDLTVTPELRRSSLSLDNISIGTAELGDISGDNNFLKMSVQPDAAVFGYAPYERPMRFIAMRRWTTYEQFCSWLFNINVSSFYINEHRNAIRKDWYSMAKSAPFAQARRFPVVPWVNMEDGNLSAIVGKLLASLDMPTRLIERESGKGTKSSPETATALSSTFDGITNVSDAKRAFDVCVGELRALAYSQDWKKLQFTGIYDREMFESHFGLTWYNGGVSQVTVGGEASVIAGPSSA
nr:MAG: coat protein [Virgaviridae-like virus 7]